MEQMDLLFTWCEPLPLPSPVIDFDPMPSLVTTSTTDDDGECENQFLYEAQRGGNWNDVDALDGVLCDLRRDVAAYAVGALPDHGHHEFTDLRMAIKAISSRLSELRV